MRIAIAALWHETNTFAVEQNDRLDASVQVGEEILAQAHPKSFVGGFVEAAREPGVELVPTVQVRFVHGGTIHGSVYDHYVRQIVDALRAAAPLDAVYFALHGALAAEPPYLHGDEELLRRAREALGAIPFVATYDFHQILNQREAMILQAAFPNDTNPHVDGYERGQEAATCILRTVRGELHPVTRVVHVPIVGPNIGQSTWNPTPAEEARLPLFQLNQVRAELERTPGIVNLTIQGGYGYADTPDTMMSVIATADRDPDLALGKARELAKLVWDKREAILNVRPVQPVDEGVRRAMARADGPIVLVDLGDDPGSACPADSPVVLESLVRQGARDAVVTMRDTNAVEAGLKAGVGATLTLEVGGSVDQRFYRPVRVTGTVRLIDDGNYVVCGPSHGGWGREVSRAAFREASVGPRVVLRLPNKVDVIFTRNNRTGKDRDFFKSAGILFEEKKIVVVKSNQAHRASFDSFVADTIDLATPGVSTVDYASLPYRYLRRPLWPIDRDFDWDSSSA